jgi:subtilisin
MPRSRRQLLLLTLGIVGSLALAGLWWEGSSSANAQPPQADRGQARMVDVLIGFERTPGAAERRLVESHGGGVKRSFWLVPAIAASVPENSIGPLSKARGVTVVEPDGEFHIIDHEAGLAAELVDTWGVQHIGAGEVHGPDHAPMIVGTGVGVAVLDTGIDYDHPEFDGIYAGGYDFHNHDNDPLDDNGHGTHVSGTVAAARDGKGVVGAAPDVHLYALKTMSDRGSGSFSSVIDALQWCVAHNVAVAKDEKPADVPILVTNHSYGSSRNPGRVVQEAFDNSYAAGILHVAAAGNSGNPRGNGNNVGYPARYDSVIAVAATDQENNRAWWSSTGPDVELSAPGVVIFSTVPGGGYDSWSGTSMASPHVAGVAALVFSAHLDCDNVGVVRNVLADTAIPLGSHNHYGYGLVDAVDAVTAVLLVSPD